MVWQNKLTNILKKNLVIKGVIMMNELKSMKDIKNFLEKLGIKSKITKRKIKVLRDGNMLIIPISDNEGLVLCDADTIRLDYEYHSKSDLELYTEKGKREIKAFINNYNKLIKFNRFKWRNNEYIPIGLTKSIMKKGNKYVSFMGIIVNYIDFRYSEWGDRNGSKLLKNIE